MTEISESNLYENENTVKVGFSILSAIYLKLYGALRRSAAQRREAVGRPS